MEEKEIKHILETEVITNLMKNRTYFTTVIHQLEAETFNDPGCRMAFDHIKKHYLKYTDVPTLKELLLTFKDSPKETKQSIKPILLEVQKTTEMLNPQLLLDLTEKFIKMSKFAKAIIKGADALGSHNEEEMAESYALAEDAIKVSLNEDLGVSLDEIEKVYLEFQDKPGVKLDIPSFDQMIGSGFTPKTLHAVMAASGVGKSAAMVAFAVQWLLQGRDVVIASLEMSEAEMYKRIYANLYDIDIATLGQIDQQVIKMKYEGIKDNIGNLVVKEFPTGGLTPLGLDSFLDKLKTEKEISKPIVMVDYLGIMASDRIKSLDNSYAYFGSIAEELRAVAQKRDIIMFTALQLNRGAINNLEADQSALAESMKILMILDSAFIIAQTPQMKEEGKMKINYVKNRMSGKTWSFDIGFNYHKFRFVDTFSVNGENVTAGENDFATQLAGLM